MSIEKIIKVLIVDDSHLMCKVLTDVLNSDPHIIVSAVASNGKDAFELAKNLKPDIITMDVHMPVMDGVQATELIMAYVPTPILIITSSDPKKNEGSVFDAINNGALDFVEKQGIDYYSNKINRAHLIEKIKYLSKTKVITHPKGKHLCKNLGKHKQYANRSSSKDKIIAVASSTGGTEAIARILEVLPSDLPCAIAIVQHMTAGFDYDFASWLDTKSQLKIKVAEDGEIIKKGTVYLAPADFQMRINNNKKIALSKEPGYCGHCPSGDVLLASVSKVYEKNAIGMILTGMGADGARGIKAIHDVGGITVAQDEKSSVIYGMPKAAVELKAVDHIVPLNKIAEKIIDIVYT